MQDQSHTLIGVTKTAASLLYTALAIIGLTIGYIIPQFAKWALSLPWIPFEGPLRLVTSFQGSPAAFITALLGMCAGIWFAHSIIAMLLSVKITDDTVELIKGKKVQTIRSDDIALVFIDHKRLVLLGTAGYELAREEIDEKPEKVEKAFRKHNYDWADSWASLFETKAHASIGEKQKPILRTFSIAKDRNNRGSRKSLFSITAQ